VLAGSLLAVSLLAVSLLAAPLLVAACSSSTGAPPAEDVRPADRPAAGDQRAAADSQGADAAPGTVTVPLVVGSDPGAAGKFLLAPVSVNGSAPIRTLLDTGSSGLRVFAWALDGTTVRTTSEATKTQFGGPELLLGHKASASVSIGAVAAPGSLTLELVESIGCAPGSTSCDPASFKKYLADSGIQGVLGVGLRADPSGIYSPLAQLAPPLSQGYLLRTSGFSSKDAELVVGERALAGVKPLALQQAGTLPNGLPAWADDAIQLCFKVSGAPTDPPCSAGVLDTGSNLDVLYARNLPASLVTGDGLLASGVSFEAAIGQPPAFTLSFTVGSPATTSLDGVLVQQDEAFSILGIELFFRFDVAYDVAGGRIGLRAR